MLIFLTSILWGHFAFSTTGLQTAGPATPFYRNPQSQFASGQISRSKLEEKLLRSELEVHYQVEWDHRAFILPGKNIYRDLQLSKSIETVTTARLLLENKSTSSTLESISKGTLLKLIKCDEYWAFVFNPSSQKTGFVPLQLVKPRSEDLGYFVSLIDTYLKKTTSAQAEIITTIPRATRLEVLQFEKGWIKIQFNGFTGYADINHFVSRADYARWAFTDRWVQTKYREDDYLISENNKKIPLSSIKGFVTDDKLGIVGINPNDDLKPPLRAQVKIINPVAANWGVSLIEGHGEVWWKKSELVIDKTPEVASETITTEELLKRKVYSLSFANKSSTLGIVSANGVYRSEDGQHWKLLPQFAEQNLPVSIHPDGVWFVGSYRSSDKGKTFEPFIRWDRIAQTIESSLHRTTPYLKITRIDSLPNSQVQISVDTGIKNLKLRSDLKSEYWTVSR